MNQSIYTNKNGMPAVCWIVKPTYKTVYHVDASGIPYYKQAPRDKNDDAWYIRAKPLASRTIPALIYVAHSYVEAMAFQLIFLEKAKRNVAK